MIISFGETDGDCEAMVLRGCVEYVVDVTISETNETRSFWLRGTSKEGLNLDAWEEEQPFPPDGTPSVRLAWDDIEEVHIW